MISSVQAVFLGLLQGITELFPISSLGHSALLPPLLHWNLAQNTNSFLTFLVATHFATALVLLVMYRNDWRRIARGIFRSLVDREISDRNPDGKLGWFLVAGTVPAALAGVLFETKVQEFFASPIIIAFALFLNGIMLFGAEALRRRKKSHGALPTASAPTAPQNETLADHRIAQTLSFGKSIAIGCFQIIALIPGFSRTGATLSGGLVADLSHEDALRFSFLLATPIIGAAALLKLPPLLTSGDTTSLAIAFIGALAAAVAAYLAARFLARYFETKTLVSFALYCIALGVVAMGVI